MQYLYLMATTSVIYEVTTWYVRDATGNVLAVYEQEDDTLRWKEQHLFGSSRLGMVQPDVVVSPLPYQKTVPHFIRNKEQPYGARRYELSNHLGNVMAVLSDRKMPRDLGSSVTYDAVVHSASDYSTFGSLMTGRTYSAGGYRYGMGGHEQDDEVKGVGNHLSFMDNGYDPRIGRRWNMDRIVNHSITGYAAFNNNPIYFVDPSGDTVKIHVTTQAVGTTKINLYSSGEVKSGIKQQTKEVDVYQVDVTNESESSATFYFTRKSYRGDKDNTSASPKDVTFDPAEDGEIFLGKIRNRWGKTDNVLEITPTSGKREDGYDSYRGLADGRKLVNRKYIQFHIKGASDGCLLCVGSDQFETTKEGVTIDKSNLSSNSGGSQTNFMSKIKELRKEDKNAGKSDAIIIQVDQLKKD